MMKLRHYIKNFANLVKELAPSAVDLSIVDIWQQDETRAGQQRSLTRV